MKRIAEITVSSIGFLWLGLTMAPGAGPTTDIVRTGLVCTVSALAGFALVAYLTRDRSAPVREGGPGRPGESEPPVQGSR